MRRALLWAVVLVVVLGLAAGFGLVGLVARVLTPKVSDLSGAGWYARTVYPLDHEAAINASARRNGLDPALVAAVVYTESRFDAGARSSRGAVGLMQVLPSTAQQIARETGGVAFVPADLEDPKVNLRYGCYYLHGAFVRFGGSTIAAVAAYNAGDGPVEAWVAQARAAGHDLRLSDIRFPETQAYVRAVLRARRAYRRAYADKLKEPT